MFTVIICDKHIIDDCYNKYYIYLKPFLVNDNFAFCKWDISGSTLDEAVPELKEKIGSKKDWRAIIVNDSSTWDFNAVYKRNPFNYVDSKNSNNIFENINQVKAYRIMEENMMNKALTNPLMTLSAWLCGTPMKSMPDICYKGFEQIFEDISSEKDYFEKARQLNLSANEIELDRIRLARYEVLLQKFGSKGELFNPPKSILALSERTKDVSKEVADSAWIKHIEFDYSQFSNENLYSEKLRYLICDIAYLKGKRNESKYFDFLTAVLLLAANEIPSGVMRANRAYNLVIKIDFDCVKELCISYNSKLNATLSAIDNDSRRLKEKQHQPIDRDTSEFYFESGVTVPVDVDGHFEEDNLMAKYDEIGLAKDCPSDELYYWNEQYDFIEKLFLKYLKEPRKAVKIATVDKFPSMNKNIDDRAARLDEFQRENVLDFLNEEEQRMITTKTTHLYNTAEYKKQMHKADKEIRNGINYRMTKKKTISIALIVVLAYFIGFIPMFISNLNSVKSFVFSLGISAAAITLLLVAGIITLFVFKKELVNRFKNFNSVVREVLDEINGSLNGFSLYLSSACNVMREFSVLDLLGNSYTKKQNTLKNHQRIITEKIKEVNNLFSSYLDNASTEENRTITPYEFDFTKMCEYQYEMPYSKTGKTIVFMQEGNEIIVPIDYLKSVTVEREELYD